MYRLFGILFLTLFSLCAGSVYAANEHRVLVVFPQLNATYNQIFANIVAGIDSHPAVEAITYDLTNSTSEQDLKEAIKAQKIEAVIALGQSSYGIASKMNSIVPVIHGGLLLKPNGHSGISLVGSPAEFFSHLANLAPAVKRVFTVYSEENSGWLIKLAYAEAKKYDIELVAVSADNMRDAVHKFRGVLDTAHDNTDAIWLLLDKVVPDKTILPLALEAAWEKGTILFSNNPSHTKRGALFSLYPDHTKMGYNLADLATRQMNPNHHPIVLPLEGLKISFNERTASHLGLRYSKSQLDSFDIIYPQR